MYPRLVAIARRFAVVLTATFLLSPIVSTVFIGSAPDAAFAQAADPAAEAKAFEESKALGTIEAWNA